MFLETRTGALREGPGLPGAPLLPAPPSRPSFGRWMLVLSCVLHCIALFSLFASGVGLGGEDRPETIIEVDFISPPAADPDPVVEPASPPPEPAPPPSAPPPEPKAAPPPPEIKPLPVRNTKPAREPRHAERATPAPVAASAPATSSVSAAPQEAGVLPLRDESLAAYGRLVWARIERRKPRDVHAPGVATVTFALAADGALLSARLSSGSGVESLDRAALDAVILAAPFPAPPPGATPTQLVFSIPFQFR